MTTGFPTPQVIGPGTESCSNTPTRRRIPDSLARASTRDWPAAHGFPDFRRDRIWQRPITKGMKNKTVPAIQPTPKSSGVVTGKDGVGALAAQLVVNSGSSDSHDGLL